MNLYVGMDTTERAGAFTVTVSGAAGSGVVTLPAGLYCHLAISNPACGTYASAAVALQAALNALSSGWFVNFSAATNQYTVSRASLTFQLLFSTEAAKLFGFPTTITASGLSATSTIRPYYVIVPAQSFPSDVSDLYEPNELVVEVMADDGTTYSNAPERIAIDDGSPIYLSDWTHPFESAAATLKRAATASVPYTWQHFVTGARATHPFVYYDNTRNRVCRLRAEGAAWSEQVRKRHSVDFDGYWDIAIKAYDLGAWP